MPDPDPRLGAGTSWFGTSWQTLLALALIGGFALWAHLSGEAFYVSLATRIAVLAIAGIGLNVALGLGGMVSCSTNYVNVCSWQHLCVWAIVSIPHNMIHDQCITLQ